MRITCDITIGDMSANRRGDWIDLKGNHHACLDIGWPATGTPVGTIAIEVSNHGEYGVAGAVYTPAIATQPAGTANTVVADGIETDAKYICVTYTRTSGGTGASFTNSTGVAGTVPRIVVTE